MKCEKTPIRSTFIDLFSGCGGLSLGLCQAGWKGQFAVERATDAFETFRSNFLAKDAPYPFSWPAWLEQKAHSIDEVLEQNSSDLMRLRGSVDLVAGGPPCQGFSFAGKRRASDPRNKLSQRYVDFVALVKPKFLVLENVPGMDVAHKDGRGKNSQTYYQRLIESLVEAGYIMSGKVLDAADFGVPQRLTRLIAIGILSGLAAQFANASGSTPYAVVEDVFNSIRAAGSRQLLKFGSGSHVSASEAISDLVVGKPKTLNTEEYIGDMARRGYRQVKYQGPTTEYQRKMAASLSQAQMDSMRLARHGVDVEKRFDKILETCQRGVNISADMRAGFGMRKLRTVPMHRDRPAPTLTTLPDDILHYSDPRILTVREYARLQSFPDWFRFKGKYTTGGKSRRHDCPRYTQVGNAVPPLLGAAIGDGLLSYLCSSSKIYSIVWQSGSGISGKESLAV
jgi:DNA (cytosine-5)-methyltransferase 1